ncbi:hypothetical protein B0A54_12363 [Friedmanniomyces endolithicus]|uniref:Queuosine 5'-phosphate N-glycosylase/hydrolase n=1 Tax=Friedmanniomyces endolithicus TaxID=329885 RepID=A0A4U0ULY9_9PEZI|nr:hypothetical protein B0A54_12363 [Friedmanniomyces endolithicus]
MSDDDADPELLELLRQSLGISSVRQDGVSSNTGVLADAEHVYNNSIDVAIDMYGTKAAAGSIYQAMQERGYSTQAWSEHELHPKQTEGFSEIDIVNFIFTMDLLNFSFWSGFPEKERFQVEYRGRRWTGYNSLLACLRRGLDEGVPITSPRYWRSREATVETLRMVFRSATDEPMPLLDQRIAILREAAEVLHESFDDGVDTVQEAPSKEDDPEVANPLHMESSATDELQHASSVDNVTKDAAAVRDMNNPNALMADSLDDSRDGETPEATAWAAEIEGPGPTQSENAEEQLPAFETQTQAASESDHMPQDHAQPSPIEASLPPPPDSSVIRLIEQANHSAGKLVNLLAQHFPCFRDETRFDGRKVRFLKRAQIFVADLWAAFSGTGYGAFDDIECLTMFAAEGEVNAVLIDFFLYDLAKERERGVGGGLEVPHHRTRSIWY